MILTCRRRAGSGDQEPRWDRGCPCGKETSWDMRVAVTEGREGKGPESMLTERPLRSQKAKGLSAAMRFLAAMVVVALPHSGVWGAEQSARLHVDYTASLLSVEAHHVSVQDVLVALSDQVGFTVIRIGPITAPVSACVLTRYASVRGSIRHHYSLGEIMR